MNKQLIRICLIAAVAILAGCNRTSVEQPASSEAILAVVRTNIDALNREDLAGAMAAFHPNSPGLQQSRDMSEKLFKAYDLRYTLKELAVDSETAEEARVRVSQITEKVSGPAFRNNRISGIHLLKKHNGEWKLYSTQITKVDYLDN